MAGWIGVDLDGTLAHFDHWRGPDSIGLPIPAMVKRVEGWIAEGREVRIFTARATEPRLIPPIKRWLKLHGLPDLRVTNVKDFQMIELWDDRAVQVIHNTGRAVQPKVLDEAARPDLIDPDTPEQASLSALDETGDHEVSPTPEEVEAFKEAVKSRTKNIDTALLDALDAGDEFLPLQPTPMAKSTTAKVVLTAAVPEAVIESSRPAWDSEQDVESYPSIALTSPEPSSALPSDADATINAQPTPLSELDDSPAERWHTPARGLGSLPSLSVRDDEIDDGFPSLRIETR